MEFRFNVGDTVYFSRSREPIKGTVYEIKIYKELDSTNIVVQYKVRYLINNIPSDKVFYDKDTCNYTPTTDRLFKSEIDCKKHIVREYFSDVVTEDSTFKMNND